MKGLNLNSSPMVDGTVGTFDFRLFCKIHLQATEFSLVS